MINIKNSADVLEIDILGEIGESWFDDATSMQSIKDLLNANKGVALNVNISSLGGDVFHAFAIYDFLKMHDAPVNVKIIGATASSGTIIAMAGNKVEMSENAFFLIHNVWTVAMGNANELREQADQLEMVDGKLVDMYQRAINKRGKNKKKSEILSLMEDEKWIDATEALAWGFVDSVIKDGRVINNSLVKQINNSHLPKLEQMENNSLFEKIRNLFGINDDPDMDEQVFNKIETLKADLEAKEAEVETLKSDLQAAAEQAQEVEAVKEEAAAELAKANEEHAAALSEINAKYEALELEHNTLKAQKTGVNASGDPILNAGTVEMTASEKAAREAVKGMEHLANKFKK